MNVNNMLSCAYIFLEDDERDELIAEIGELKHNSHYQFSDYYPLLDSLRDWLLKSKNNTENGN